MAKHAPNESKKNKSRPYFNTYNLPDNADRFIKSVENASRAILNDSYVEWCTLGNINAHVKETWDDDSFIEEFKMFWCMALIREHGYIIWNTVFRENVRSIGEHKASSKADETMNMFLRKYA